jgi:hypothetical protein
VAAWADSTSQLVPKPVTTMVLTLGMADSSGDSLKKSAVSLTFPAEHKWPGSWRQHDRQVHAAGVKSDAISRGLQMPRRGRRAFQSLVRARKFKIFGRFCGKKWWLKRRVWDTWGRAGWRKWR